MLNGVQEKDQVGAASHSVLIRGPFATFPENKDHQERGTFYG